MVLLRTVEVFYRQHFNRNLFIVLSLFSFYSGLYHRQLTLIRIIYSGSVLCTHIIALLIHTDRINYPEIIYKQIFKTDNLIIKIYLHSLRMPRIMSAHVLIARIFGPAVGISAGSTLDTLNSFKVAFHSPKATAGKVYCIHIYSLSISKICLKNIVDIVYRIFEKYNSIVNIYLQSPASIVI